MKISALIISLLMVGLFAGVLGLFFGGLSSSYGQDYDNTTFDEYQQFEELSVQAEELDEKLGAVGGDATAVTWTSAFISGGYTVVKTTGQSFGTFNTMADSAIDSANLGSGTSYFKNYLLLAAFIAFVFIIVAVIVGRISL